MRESAAANEALRDEIREAESDLIDSYVCERLSESQRSQFERHFLDSQEKRERVDLSQMLLSPAVRRIVQVPEFDKLAYSRGVPDARRLSLLQWLLSPRFGLAVAALALAIATAVVVVQNLHLRSQADLSRYAELNSQNQIAELRNQVTQLRKSGNSVIVVASDSGLGEVSVSLLPGQQRDSGSERSLLKLPPQPRIALTLQLEQDQYPEYDLVLGMPAEKKDIRRWRGVKSRPGSHGGPVLVARLSSKLLARGEYVVRVIGRTPDGDERDIATYYFAVTR